MACREWNGYMVRRFMSPLKEVVARRGGGCLRGGLKVLQADAIVD